MIYCNMCFGDYYFGKYNGLGGKIEVDEDVVVSMCCEIVEEVGIDCIGMCLCGIFSWFGFGKYGEDWLGFVFVIDSFEGILYGGNYEGMLEWVDLDKLDMLLMWEGDCNFLLLVFDVDLCLFYGVMLYKDGCMVSWFYSWL